MNDFNEQVKNFQKLWKGGFLGGDPLDPVAVSGYGDIGYISVLYAIYQACVRPYVTPSTVVLEIGPGRGAWTKGMLPATEIWCLDALPADHNCFWEYLGQEHRHKIRYIQVSDFSCRDLPENYFDFIFSFGTFCHISWEGQCAYYRNLYPKAKAGATAMVMIADFDKYNAAYRNVNKLRTVRIGWQGLLRSARFNARVVQRRLTGKLEQDKSDTTIAPGKWYHAGVERTCRFLTSIGWEVVNPDVGLIPRDPVIHFRKPA
jgi:hypothetical protein